MLQTALMPDYRSLWLKCVEVKNDLLSALQHFYPFVRLEVFGSTVMGIAFKGNLMLNINFREKNIVFF